MKRSQSAEDIPSTVSSTQSNGTATTAASTGAGCVMVSGEPRKLALRTQLAHQLSGNSSKTLKRPLYVVRPAPPPPPPNAIPRELQSPSSLVQDRNILLPVFRWLTVEDLGRCASVCRAWSRVSIDPSLWRHTDLSRRRLAASLLAGVVRRQPEALILDWTSVAKRQLAWLIARLPQLKELSLRGCHWAGVSALRTCACPPLSVLDMSFVAGLNDASLRDVLSPPPDSRPGLVDTKSRLRGLRTLCLAGCDISDVALRYITQHLPRLTVLDISSCSRVTDAGVAQLATPPASTMDTLQTLDLSSCRLLTDASLEHLARCDALSRLDLRHTPNVTAAAIAKFAVRSRHGLKVMDGKLIAKRNLNMG